MKKIFALPLIVFLSHGITTVQAAPQLKKATGTVVVQVTNIDLKKAHRVKIGLYNETSSFPLLGKETFGKNIEASKSVVSHTFENIPAGTYAAAVIQDENDDGIHNTNFFGAPTERYGFSHNKYGFWSPPDYGDVSFHVNSGETVTLTVNLEK